MSFLRDKLKKIIQELLKDEELKQETKTFIKDMARDVIKEQLQTQIKNLG